MSCRSCADSHSFYWYSHEALCFRCLRTYLNLLERVVFGVREPLAGFPRFFPGES